MSQGLFTAETRKVIFDLFGTLASESFLSALCASAV